MGTRKYISKDKKELILQISERMKNDAEAAKLVDVSVRTITRLRALHRKTGEVVKKPEVAGRRRKLNGLDTAFLEDCLCAKPDMMLSELCRRLTDSRDAQVCLATVQRTLVRRGLAMKSKASTWPDEPTRAQFRAQFAQEYRADQLVAVDETGPQNIPGLRNRAWMPVGGRRRRHEIHVRRTRYTILPAFSLSGLPLADISSTPCTPPMFREFVLRVLDRMSPFPQPNSVLLLDPTPWHRLPEIEQEVARRGMRILYLPKHSPDLNPTEQALSALKSWLQENEDYSRVEQEVSGPLGFEPGELLREGVEAVMRPDMVEGWLRRCGYLA